MSNNKQSSVEWLYNKMYEHRGNITIEEFEQAKAMHKQENFQERAEFFGYKYTIAHSFEEFMKIVTDYLK